MGDSETIVAQTSTVMEYTSTGYTTTDYTAENSNVTSDGGVIATGATEDSTGPAIPTDTAYPLPDGSSVGEGIAYSTDPKSATQEPPLNSTSDSRPVVEVSDTSENLVSQENAVGASAEVVGYDSSVNVNGLGEVRNFTPMGSGENGNALNDVGGASAEQHFEDSSGIFFSVIIDLQSCVCVFLNGN